MRYRLKINFNHWNYNHSNFLSRSNLIRKHIQSSKISFLNFFKKKNGKFSKISSRFVRKTQNLK